MDGIIPTGLLFILEFQEIGQFAYGIDALIRDVQHAIDL